MLNVLLLFLRECRIEEMCKQVLAYLVAVMHRETGHKFISPQNGKHRSTQKTIGQASSRHFAQ